MALENGENGDGKRREGLVQFARRWWRAAFGEALATALLVGLGVASTLPTATPSGLVHPPLEHPALTFGCMVLALIQVFGAVSGAHMNPAVTLAALLHGQLGAAPAALYAVAQTLGAVLGFATLVALAPTESGAAPAGCTLPAAGVSALAALLVEALLTAALCLLACALWSQHDASRPDHTVPVKFGLTVAGLVYAGGALTGASFNPVRSFGPALIQSTWRDHWVYWVGPLAGGAVAALLHRHVLSVPPPPPRADRGDPRDDAEALPLSGKPADC